MKYLIGSIFLLFMGHIFRFFRTFFVLRQFVDKPLRSYLISLGGGYLLEFLAPIRLSDIIRIYIFAKMGCVPWQLPIAVTIFERCLDFLFLTLIFYTMVLDYQLVLTLFATLLFGIMFLSNPLMKRVFYQFSSFFNSKIKNFLLGIYWALFRIIKNMSVKSFLFCFVLSVCVWVFYLFSVFLLASILIDTKSIIKYQFSLEDGINLWNIYSYFGVPKMFVYVLYILVPNVLVLLAGFFIKDNSNAKQYNIIPFISHQASLSFYYIFFNGTYSGDSEIYYQLTHTGFLLSDLSAASGAKTYLLKENDKIFIRKIGLNVAAKKLKLQYHWLIQNHELSVPIVYGCKESCNLFMYDMKFYYNGSTLFDASHYLSAEDTWSILHRLIEMVRENLKTGVKIEAIFFYYNEYVKNNISIALTDQSLKELSLFPQLIVNGVEVPNILQMQNQLLSEIQTHASLPVYKLHGDLTLENILVDEFGNFIIIDPSPMEYNIFAEFSKLFQSLHGKYEYIKQQDIKECKGNIIRYAQYDTVKNEQIFQKMKDYLVDLYGMEGLGKVYFYEAICHLRTMSYMVRLKNNKSILMLALAGLALKKWKEIGTLYANQTFNI